MTLMADYYRPAAGIRFQGVERSQNGSSPTTAKSLRAGSNPESDREEFEDTCRHEAAHAAAAFGLGWSVEFVDARAGQTKVTPPPLYSQSLADKDLQHAVIACAGAVATGISSSRAELEDDRVAVLLRGFTHWEDARRKADRLMADRYVKALTERLTDALLRHGRLEGAALDRVLAGDDK